MMAAGGSIEPFWSIYAVHNNNPEVYTLLEEYRIGNLSEEDVKLNESLAVSRYIIKLLIIMFVVQFG